MISYYIDNTDTAAPEARPPDQQRETRRRSTTPAARRWRSISTTCRSATTSPTAATTRPTSCSSPPTSPEPSAALRSPSACTVNLIRKVNITLGARSRKPFSVTKRYFHNPLTTQISLRGMAFVNEYSRRHESVRSGRRTVYENNFISQRRIGNGAGHGLHGADAGIGADGRILRGHRRRPAVERHRPRPDAGLCGRARRAGKADLGSGGALHHRLQPERGADQHADDARRRHYGVHVHGAGRRRRVGLCGDVDAGPDARGPISATRCRTRPPARRSRRGRMQASRASSPGTRLRSPHGRPAAPRCACAASCRPSRCRCSSSACSPRPT